MSKKIWMITVFLTLGLGACKAKEGDSGLPVDADELSQQVGESMASIDEAGGGDGTSYGLLRSEEKIFARRAPGSFDKMHPLNLIALPSAEATTCAASPGFGGCTSSSVTRNFGGCTVSGATFTGNVVYAYNNTSCNMATVGNYVTRTPNYTVTGLRSASLRVTKTGTNGQKVIKTAASPNTYQMTNDGIRRVFTAAGITVFDNTTTIDSSTPFVITGNVRSGRTLTSGTLTVTDNVNNRTCTLKPTNVTWGSSCNCATSGTWTGSCTEGSSVTMTINGCGTASVTVGTTTQSITFDRCY